MASGGRRRIGQQFQHQRDARLDRRQRARVAQRVHPAWARCGLARSAWRARPRRPRPAPAARPLPAHGAACRCRWRRARGPARHPERRPGARESAHRPRRRAPPHGSPRSPRAASVSACDHPLEQDARMLVRRCRPVPQAAHRALLHVGHRPGIARSRRRRAGRCAPSARRRRCAPCPRRRRPRPARPALAATAIASRTFCGPSGASAVAGRIAQVSTTGLAGASTDCRKKAVSSSVSVPWVMTMPATSGCGQPMGATLAPACARSRSSCPCCRPAPPARPRAAMPSGASTPPSRSVTPTCARRVADVVAGRRGTAGDGAAGAQNDHAVLAFSKDVNHGLPNFRKLVKNTGTGYSASAARSHPCSSPSSLPPASSRFWT